MVHRLGTNVFDLIFIYAWATIRRKSFLVVRVLERIFLNYGRLFICTLIFIKVFGIFQKF